MLKIKTNATTTSLFVTIAIVFAMAGSVVAQGSIKWTNAGGDNNWNNPANWKPQEVPSSGKGANIGLSGDDRAVVKATPDSNNVNLNISGELDIKAPFSPNRGSRYVDVREGGVINVYADFHPRSLGLRFRGGGRVKLHKGTLRLDDINHRDVREPYGFTVYGGKMDVRSDLPFIPQGEIEIRGGKVKVDGDLRLSERSRFCLVGPEQADIEVGGNWIQKDNSTLKLKVDKAGISPIRIGGDVQFSGDAHGTVLDVEFLDEPVHGTLKVMAWEGDVTDEGLRFAEGMDEAVWSYKLHEQEDGGGYMTITHRQVSGLKVSGFQAPVEARLGEQISVEAEIVNPHSSEQTEQVKLLADDEVVDSAEMTLDAESSHPVNFNFTMPTTGNVEFRIATDAHYASEKVYGLPEKGWPIRPNRLSGEVPAADTSSGSGVKVKNLTASTPEPRQLLASYTVDGDRSTRWGEATDDPIWVQFELDKDIRLGKMEFVRAHRVRGATVEVRVSADGEDWKTVFKGKPDVGNENIETIQFDPVDARYVRFISHRGPGAHGRQNWIRELRVGDLPREAYADIDRPNFTEDTKRIEDRPALEPPFPKTREEINEYRQMTLRRGFERAGHHPEGGNPIRIDSLEELWKYGLQDGVHVKMEPGKYRIDSDNINKFADGLRSGSGDQKLFVFRGHNSYFDLRGVTIIFDAKAFAHYGGGLDWNTLFLLQANNLVFRGLTVDTINKRADVQGVPYLDARADSILIWDVDITTGGSIPYGYGKLLGKGGGNLTKVRKGNGASINGNHVDVVGVNIHPRHFGHALTTRGRNTFIDCHVEGDDLRRTSEILKETSGPAYEADFEQKWSDTKIQPGHVISRHEEAWRTYGNFTATMILNCTVQRTSGGYNTNQASARESGLYVSHSKWRQCHQFNIRPRHGSTFNKAAIDVGYGLGLRIDNANNVTGDFTILPSPTPLYDKPKSKPGIMISGENHDLTFKQDVPDLKIRGSRWIEVDNAENVTIDNRSDLPIKLKKGANNCTVKSTAPVEDNGSGNRVR